MLSPLTDQVLLVPAALLWPLLQQHTDRNKFMQHSTPDAWPV
jgi:hypothetical protein